jgi:transcriptional regulator with XRE-family HTH domain
MTLFLKDWRKAKGFTLKGLGEAAGVGYVTLFRAENGQQSPTVHTIEKISQALGIKTGKLFEMPPMRKPPTKKRRRNDG